MRGAMDPARPRFASRDEVFAHRPHRAAAVRFVGLWLTGSLAGLASPTVAIVGPRAPSAGGLARARDVATCLSRAGVCIVSGLALGIDGAAHVGALAGGTPTVGILGGGHDHFFPARNRDLACEMVACGGAVLSPYAPHEPARPAQFLQRNGVVAALADAVVVVEAATRSGALNTASWAASLGVDVLAFPGDVDRVVAAGCNALIRDGATLVRHADDVLEALGIASATLASHAREDAAGVARSTVMHDDPLAARILDAVAREPRRPDDLAELVGAAIGDVLATLVRLEIDGRIERRDAACFASVPRR
ncbi:MAG: hypothetical protein NVSMB59_13530 [Vulcanimicrobiaceae bacterium]